MHVCRKEDNSNRCVETKLVFVKLETETTTDEDQSCARTEMRTTSTSTSMRVVCRYEQSYTCVLYKKQDDDISLQQRKCACAKMRTTVSARVDSVHRFRDSGPPAPVGTPYSAIRKATQREERHATI